MRMGNGDFVNRPAIAATSRSNGHLCVSESTTESPDWLRRYREEYLTLDEVGELEGITREGVRQRLKRLGIEPRSLAETRRLRERHETSMQAKAIRQAFLRTRSLFQTA